MTVRGRKREASSMTFRVDGELHGAFVAACRAADRTAAQVLRDAMREFIARNPQAGLPFDKPSPVKRRGRSS